MEDALRRTLVAGFVVAVALAVPVGAFAWTPEDCADWYATHGSNHPDCQDYVPPEVTPPVETPPVVTPPVVEQPPVVTPPDVPPTVEDVPPVDTPDVVPGVTPKVEHKAPRNEVRGKEQQKPPAPLQRPVVDTGATLPFSGLPLGWVALLGAVLLAGGAACRRRVA